MAFVYPHGIVMALTIISCAESCPEMVLTWSDRLAVLIGVAKAVHFLHTGAMPASFSNRLKTNNILLDEHRIAKLSDYGMSILTEGFESLEVSFFNPLTEFISLMTSF